MLSLPVLLLLLIVAAVAGIGKMEYRRFCAFNLAGGVTWVTLFLCGGFLFGNLPVVKDNFHLVVGAIVIVSVLATRDQLVAPAAGACPVTSRCRRRVGLATSPRRLGSALLQWLLESMYNGARPDLVA